MVIYGRGEVADTGEPLTGALTLGNFGGGVGGALLGPRGHRLVEAVMVEQDQQRH